MAPRHITRDVAKALYANYLKRAEECHHAAQRSFSGQEWNAATINAIHACIAAVDALCVYYLGKRNAGDSHNEAVALFKSLPLDASGKATNANRVARILGIKNMAEYEERLVCRTEAEKAMKDSDRFLEYVKTKLPD